MREYEASGSGQEEITRGHREDAASKAGQEEVARGHRKNETCLEKTKGTPPPPKIDF